MPTYPTRARLPASYSANVGRIITRWALLEATLRQVGYGLLLLDPKLGRLMIQEPRIESYVTMIEDVMIVLRFKTSVDTKDLKRGLKTLDEIRNKLAHGVWVRHARTSIPVLQDTKGTSATDTGQPIKARINPKALAVTPDNFRARIIGIKNATKIIRQLGREIERQLRSLPCRCCGQPLPARRVNPQGKKTTTHQAQHSPSQP